MYALCDGTKDLSNLVYLNASYTEAVQLFHRLFPNVTSILVFRDLYQMRDIKHLTFVSRLTNKNILRIASLKNK